MNVKILHHIWLGDRPRSFLTACRQSAIDMHPGWEFMYHTSGEVLDHTDLKDTGLRQLYDRCKKLKGQHSPMALMADVLRLGAVYLYGGFYMDHDAYVLRPFDVFLDDEIVLSQIRENFVGEAVIGAPPRSERIMAVIRHYTSKEVKNENICMGLTGLARTHRWPTYRPIVFCPHRRNASDSERYLHGRHTWTIHCWNQKRYELSELEKIRRTCRELSIKKPDPVLIPE